MKRQAGIRIDEDLLRAIDEASGDVPRSVWIARACLMRLESEGYDTGNPKPSVEGVMSELNSTVKKGNQNIKKVSRSMAFRQAAEKGKKK